MVAFNFPASFAAVLKSEGGNDDDPEDHGGRTSRGITQREYDAWCHLNGEVSGDVWLAGDEQIAAIYRENYWEPKCDALPLGVDYLYFDFAVNAGPYRATKTLQQAIGVAADGVFGSITMEAACRANPALLISKYSEAKRAFYRALNQPRFLRGWLNRVNEAEDTANAMIKEAP